MRYFLLVFGLCIVAVMGVFGKRGDMSRRPPIQVFPDMERQPKLRPQTETQNLFWTNNMSSRLPVDGTIARGALYEDTPVNTGRISGIQRAVVGAMDYAKTLSDDVRAKNPFVIKRSVHGDRFFVILPQINLLLRKFALSPSASKPQQGVRIF